MGEDFAYGGPAGLTVSIFADRAREREDMREDAAIAGLRVVECHGLPALTAGGAAPRGRLVLVDCPAPAAAALAGLARLDMRAAASGAAVVVATSAAGLDDVFGAMDQSDAQILVAPTRAERAIALGQAIAGCGAGRVRDLSEADRMVLIQLTNQVNQIAERMGKLDRGAAGTAVLHGENPAFRFDPPRAAGAAAAMPPAPAAAVTAPPAAAAAPVPLPDPALVRRIIRQRQARARFFDGELFADPAWDMLLDLTAAHVEQARISVTSLCIASGVPPTTALRWIGQMTKTGWLLRVEDKSDRRRAFIALSERAVQAMARYFAQLGGGAERLV